MKFVHIWKGGILCRNIVHSHYKTSARKCVLKCVNISFEQYPTFWNYLQKLLRCDQEMKIVPVLSISHGKTSIIKRTFIYWSDEYQKPYYVYWKLQVNFDNPVFICFFKSITMIRKCTNSKCNITFLKIERNLRIVNIAWR